MAGEANDHFSWRLQGLCSQPRPARKEKEGEKKRKKRVHRSRTSCLFSSAFSLLFLAYSIITVHVYVIIDIL